MRHENNHQGHRSLLPGEVCLHHGSVDDRAAAVDGAEGHSLAPDAHGHPVCCPLPQPHRLHHEHLAKVDRETSVEAKDAVGRLYQVL